MDLSFASAKLRKQLSEQKAMEKAYGSRAKKVQMRLQLLAAVRCLADVPRDPPERCHRMGQDRAGQYAVDVGPNWRLVFRPAHDPVPTRPDGGDDLERITAVEILEVVDYH